MYLILALFAIIYLAAMVGSDKAKAREADIRIYKQQNLQDEFRAIATDEELELLLEEKINDYSKQEEVWQELDEIFAQIPACHNIKRFSYTLGKNYCEWSMVRRILMAKHGKIPEWEARLHSDSIPLPPQGTGDSRELRKQFKSMMSWIEKELQRHGLPVQLIVLVKPEKSAYDNQPFPAAQEVLLDEYKDPTEDGKLLDNIWGYRWRYTPMK